MSEVLIALHTSHCVRLGGQRAQGCTHGEEQLLAQGAQRHEGLLRQEEELVSGGRDDSTSSACPKPCHALV